VEDVIAVINWAVETFNKDVFLLGSSAGAPVAGSALEAHSRVKGAFLIGYPWGLWASMLFNAHFQRLQESHKPKMMVRSSLETQLCGCNAVRQVMGTRDEFTSVQVFNRKFDALQGPREKHIFEGLGHFELERPEYDSTMAEMCDRFIRGLLVPPEASEAQSNDIEAMQVTVLHAHA
jgi:alpha-beta hydrolase superfamily lysophospholipase